MKIIPIALVAVMTAGFGGSALADKNRCAAIPDQQWVSIEKISGKAEALGYTVRKAKRSKGCWKVEGFDRNGAEIEILFDPASSEIVKPRG